MGLFRSKYTFSDIVYLKTDPDQLPRMVCEIKFSAGNETIYFLVSGSQCSQHYEFEISDSKNYLLSLGIE